MRKTFSLMSWIVLLLVIPAAVTLRASEGDRGIGHWGEAVVVDTADPITKRDLGRDNAAWQRFLEHNPGNWQASWDVRNGVPHWIYGPAIEVTAGALDAGAAESFARDYLLNHADLFGIDIEGVTPVVPESSVAGHTVILNVTFEHQGVEVDDRTRVGFRFKDHGVLAAVCASNMPVSYEAATPTVAPEAAIAVGHAASLRSPDSLILSQEPALVYLPDDEMRARLAWRFQLRNEDVADPFMMDYYVHAIDSPVLLDTINGVHHTDVEGKVEGQVILFDPVTTPTTQPLRDLTVDITAGGSGEATTDAAGDYTISFGGSGAITVRSRLEGLWSRVINQAGSNEVLTQPGTPPGPFDFLHNASGGSDQALLAQAQGYYHTTVVHDFHESIIGASGADFPMPTNVNINSSCNAYYNGTINFFLAGGSCRNTCYDTVVYHEYGHFLDDVYGSVRQPYSEGIADVYAMYITDQPIVGENFTTSGGFIRTGTNTRQWPASECGGQVHCMGEVIMGFFWKMRENLKNTLGDGPGGAVANQIAVFTNATDPLTIPDAAMEAFIADDDDGNMGNGTPNFFDIAAAAATHNLDAPSPVFVDIVHSPLDNTIDQVNDRQIVATITSNAGAITSTNLYYSIGGGSFSQVAMTGTGNPDEYGASIPAQPCQTAVQYYIEATDARGYINTHPPEAPGNDSWYYIVARQNTFHFEDFEGDISDWFLLNNTDFAQGAPNQNGDNPWDPTTAYSGSQVIGTDLNIGDDDGFYTSDHFTQARSAIIDCTGKTGVHLRYRRWLTVQDGIGDTAEILVQDSQITNLSAWSNGSQAPIGDLLHQVDLEWVPHTLDISSKADGDSEVKVFFRLTTDDTMSFGGWNIDDFELFTPSCDLIKLTTSDDSPSIGGAVTFTTEGAPSEMFWLLSANSEGNGTFQVPGGPLVETGLAPASTKIRRQGTLNGAGTNATTRNVPNKPALIGRSFVLTSISNNAGYQASNLITLVIDP